uniref:Uncharacterized protein n=1 Tax=Pristionchus pacificus TaxID=54126 RepID=A0A2A6BWV7_PRIPA|eukprot:PDM70326.1 hypothetical protein PRIPAC_46572 [Pristionchus pacificus]
MKAKFSDTHRSPPPPCPGTPHDAEVPYTRADTESPCPAGRAATVVVVLPRGTLSRRSNTEPSPGSGS